MDLPVTGYGEALDIQRALVAARIEKRLDADVILALEHPPVFTLGRNRGRENLMVSDAFLEEKGVELFQTERGGDITYHGPGQLVAYPVLDMGAAGLGVSEYVSALETIMVRTAENWNIRARGHMKHRGVWVDGKKLGSIGIAVKRGIVFHGLALNVNLSLAPFEWINPCGFKNITMTTLELESGERIDAGDVRPVIRQAFADFWGGPIMKRELSDFPLSLASDHSF